MNEKIKQDFQEAKKIIRLAKTIQIAQKKEWERLENKERELESREKLFESERVRLESAVRELKNK